MDNDDGRNDEGEDNHNNKSGDDSNDATVVMKAMTVAKHIHRGQLLQNAEGMVVVVVVVGKNKIKYL